MKKYLARLFNCQYYLKRSHIKKTIVLKKKINAGYYKTTTRPSELIDFCAERTDL